MPFPPPTAGAALLAAALLATACAVPAGLPPLPEPPLPYPPAARARMLRIAVAEWEDWGRVVLEPGARPSSTRAESDPANFPRVLAYWRALPDDEGAVARNRPLYAAALAGGPEGGALWQEPYWSAAFISYVMRGAGVDTREFPPSASHAAYVDALIADALRFPAAAPFLPRAPAEYAPQPGDLLCADRSPRAPLTGWQQRLPEAGRFRPMHCDIIVAVSPGGVEAIGGNVLDAVTRSRFPTDASGVLLPPLPGAPVPFAVFENRLGRLPPWSPAL